MKPNAVLGCATLLCLALFAAERSDYAAAAVENSTLPASANGTEVRMEAGLPSVPDDDDDDFIPYQGERFTTFDWALFRALGKRYPGNLLVSPISVKLALVLLYEGAQEQAAYELSNTLLLPATRPATRDKFSTALQSLQAPSSSYTLNFGSRVYIDSNVLIRQRYGAIAKIFYQTDIVSTNMSDVHNVAGEVNAWVNNITHGYIPKMIEDEKSIKDSVMLMMNALFFRGSWSRKYFLPENTKPGNFYTATNESVEVPFMHCLGRFYYSESSELDAKILRIPYDGHKFSMYVILPLTLTGADQLMKQIRPSILTRHVWLMQDLPVDVLLPKFKFEFSNHLETVLRELGIRDVFDDTATLTGIAKTKRTSRHLKVTDIVQKSGIEVNENGTTAFTAIEVQVANKIEEEVFHATQPFIFYIEDETTGTILYVGKVANPAQTEGNDSGCTVNN